MTDERYNKLMDVLKHRQYGLGIVLEDVHDPHNIAAVLRTCDAVGVQDVYVIDTGMKERKEFGPRSSSSAAKWITVHQFTSAEDCFTELRKRFDKIYTTHLAQDAIGLYEIDLTQNIALVFGNEHFGVSDKVISLADGNFIIPQQGIIQSLNISVACAVTLYEAYRQRKNAGLYDTHQMPEKETYNLKEEWGLNLFEKII